MHSFLSLFCFCHQALTSVDDKCVGAFTLQNRLIHPIKRQFLDLPKGLFPLLKALCLLRGWVGCERDLGTSSLMPTDEHAVRGFTWFRRQPGDAVRAVRGDTWRRRRNHGSGHLRDTGAESHGRTIPDPTPTRQVAISSRTLVGLTNVVAG